MGRPRKNPITVPEKPVDGTEEEQSQLDELKDREREIKTFTFESDNAYMWVGFLNIQFRKGRYTTSDPDVAEQLRKLEGVREV